MNLRLSLLIPSLSQGGAEHSLARLANHWADVGHHVSLCTLDSVDHDSYTLHSQIERRSLGGLQTSRSLWQGLTRNLNRLRRVRRALDETRPDCVVSFLETTNVLALLASRGRAWPVLIAERTNPVLHPVSSVWRFLRQRTYARAAGLIVQTESAAESLRPIFPQPITVIPNGVPRHAAVQAEQVGDPRPPVVLAAGRLSPEKGFDKLIRAFAMASEGLSEWRLRILGEGAERKTLNQTSESLRVADRLEMPGFMPDMESELAGASVFVLSSEYEGFPNVLLEAMAAGCGVVASDCRFGPREIVRHEIDGLLVADNDPTRLSPALRRLMEDVQLRTSLGRRAIEVCDRFSLEQMFERWDAAIHAAAGR